MLKYIRTSIKSDVLLPLILNQLRVERSTVVITDKIKEELNNTYKVDLNMIINYILKNIRCSELKENLIQIYIIDEPVKGNRLHDILQFIDYGTLNIKGNMAITKYINGSIYKVKNRIGGI